MQKVLRTCAVLAGLCAWTGNASGEEILLGQVAYIRIDVIAKKENQGIWTFTQKRDTGEVLIIKLVPGSAFEIESVTPWTRTSTLQGIAIKESFAYPFTEMFPGGKNFGHVEAMDSHTKSVLYRWPMFCHMTQELVMQNLVCRAHMDDGGLYEVTRHFLPRQAMKVLVEHRRVLEKDGTVVSNVVDILK